jgi:deoxyribonuclease V
LIAFLDVHYSNEGARAACALVESWTDPSPKATFVADIGEILPYEPGFFYRRELPCLQAVLSLLPEPPEILVIDGYVWLGGDRRPGLGARLHEASNGIPVVGIAKTRFKGLEGSDLVEPVFRGKSANPLYVTAAGLDVKAAALAVSRMHGKHRVPEMARITDNLARGVEPSVPRRS